MTQIHPHLLWIGHAGEGRDISSLADAGIEALVNLAAEERFDLPPREFVSLRFPLIDGTGNRSAWLELAITTVASLIELKIPTIVACGAGMSRAPTIVAAALASALHKSPEDCLQDVVSQHPTDVSPGLWDEVKAVLDRRGL
jgi:Polymorphic toxin system, DSP-PTPase phosphatase